MSKQLNVKGLVSGCTTCIFSMSNSETVKHVNVSLQQGKWCDATRELSSIAPEVIEPSAFSAELTPAGCTDDSDDSEAD